MADFDGLLKNTLSSINERFNQAERDLYGVVEEVSTAIKNNSSKAFALYISSISETYQGTTYRVYFDLDEENPSGEVETIDTFHISSKGYPIQQGIYRKTVGDFIAKSEFPDRESIEGYFQEMLANPDSALIQSIGFGMRKMQNSGVDGEIPF